MAFRLKTLPKKNPNPGLPALMKKSYRETKRHTTGSSTTYTSSVKRTVRRWFCLYFSTPLLFLRVCACKVCVSTAIRNGAGTEKSSKIQIRPKRAIRHRSQFSPGQRDNPRCCYYCYTDALHDTRDGYTRVFSVNFYLIVVFLHGSKRSKRCVRFR